MAKTPAKAKGARKIGSFAALPEGEKVKRLAQLAEARKKLAERYRLKEGEGSTADAARWAGVGTDAIRTAVRNEELKASSINPFRFDRDVVKRWASTRAKGENDLSIHEVVAMLPGLPGKIKETGISEKYDRVRGIIRRLKMGYERRSLSKQKRNRNLTCIAKDRFAELKKIYLDLTGEDEELLPGEITICDAATKYDRPYGTICDRLTKHAPSAIRKVKLERGRYSRKTKVAPEAAIEAALRGENWTPPTAESNGEPLPAAPVEAATNGKTPPPKPEEKKTKSKGGRPSKWDELRAMIEASPNKTNPEIAAAYNKRYGSQFPLGKIERANADRVRMVKADMNRKS